MMIGLISQPISKGGRILVPTSSRSYKGGRFLGQHGGGKPGRGGRVLGSKTSMSSLRRVSRPKVLIKNVPSPRKAPAKRPDRRTGRRARPKKLKRNSIKHVAKTAFKKTLRRSSNSMKNIINDAVSSGKTALKVATKQLMRKVPTAAARGIASIAHSRKRSRPDEDENGGFVPPPSAVKRARYHGPPSIKKGYLSGTKQYGGLRLF